MLKGDYIGQRRKISKRTTISMDSEAIKNDDRE